ncbi:hypothetical protein I204_08335 [Kwoniella mangroviensis CBS 8886]|nr:hypothetical protein I204_08335 [Kwoniella mangroviensis CBS 8886]
MTIDASAEDDTCFLDLMHNKPPHKVSDWSQAEKVLDLIEQYECDIAGERMCQRDHVETAKHALKSMQVDSLHKQMNLYTLSYEDAAEVALPYLLGLIQTLGISSYTDGFKGSVYHNDWASISQSFKPLYPVSVNPREFFKG